MTKKNRLAQSGPYRRGLGSGAVLQEAIATRAAAPNSTGVPALFAELASGNFGGTDLRPGLVPIFDESNVRARVEMTVEFNPPNELTPDQTIDIRLELSDDDGATWVAASLADPAAILPTNVGTDGAGFISNVTRNQISAQVEVGVLTLFPDWEGEEIVARAMVQTGETSSSSLVSEGDPGNCRVILQEVTA